ncbi:unnamed protein product [Heligmosomoides polygyrus]|uniref:Rubis-subs-bind domain-containing protein n=1 Tax=Heligmosomoides polygyrus TaxID=6339 RepID=A0A183G1I1_HELPZ|nr:unnamed protein product [Heligmosomoides polygyrus]
MTSAEDEDAAHLETICRLVLENQGLRELLNAATIATPDMKEKFSRALAASRAKNDEKMMNGTLASSDDGSDTEGELDSTAVEKAWDDIDVTFLRPVMSVEKRLKACIAAK